MANVTVDVHARLDPRTLRRASTDAHDHFQRAGQDAGQAFSANLARGVQQGSSRIGQAMGTATQSTDRLRRAYERLNRSYQAGDVEAIIRDTQRLAREQRNAVTQTDRLAAAQRTLSNAVSGGAGGLMMVGRAFGAVASSGPGAIAAVTAAAGAIVQIGGIAASAAQSLWILPAALGGIASAVGTVQLATSGMDDVFSSLGDPEAFAEAIRKVSPAAAELGMTVQSALPYLKDLQQAVQQEFFAGTGPMLGGLMDQFLPEIQSLTTGIASAMNQAMAGVAGQLMTPDTQASIDAFITNIVSAFQNLAPAVAPLTQALAQIMEVGSGALPGLTAGITAAANAFATFIENASRSGDLQKWLEEGLTTLSQVGDIIADVGRILMELAPVGQDVLPSIVTAFDDIANYAGPVIDIIRGIAPAVEFGAAAVRLATGDFSVLQDVIGGVGDFAKMIFNKVRDVLDKMFDPVRAGIELFNSIPGVIDIPQIPHFGTGPGAAPSMPRTSVDGIHGTDAESQILFGNNPVAGLPGSSGRPDPFWGSTPQRWGSDPQGFTRLDSDRQDLITGSSSSSSSSSSTSSTNVERMMALAQASNGGTYAAASDLQNGLADCSGAISDLVEVLINGKSTPQRLFTTEAFRSDAEAAKFGFFPGFQPGALNVGVNPYPGQSGHMAATLPNGTNFESTGSGIRYGNGAAGALDPQFEKQYFRPVDGLGTGRLSSSPTPVTVDGFSPQATNSLSQGLGLDDDLGLSRGLPGLLENLVRAIGLGATAPMMLQLQQQGGNPAGFSMPSTPSIGSPSMFPSAPSTLPAFGGVSSATPFGSPIGAPSAFLPSSPALGGGNPLGGLFGGPSPSGASAMPASYAPPGAPLGNQGAAQYNAKGWGEGGWQAEGGGFAGLGGLPMAAISSAIGAAGGAGSMFGGQAASAAAQMGMELVNRAVGYGGQVAGIAAGGLLETFGLQDSVIGDPSKSWIGKILMGFSGAKPATSNTTANETPLKPKDGPEAAKQGAADAKANSGGGPILNIESYVQAPNRDGKGAAKDIAYDMYAKGGR